MNARWITLAILASGIVADVWLVLTGRETISAYVWQVSRDWPIVPFALGVLAGHWFWPLDADHRNNRDNEPPGGPLAPA